MAIDPLPRRAGLMEREHDFVTLPDIKPKELAAIDLRMRQGVAQ